MYPNLRHDWPVTDVDSEIAQPGRPTRPYRLERPRIGRWAAGVARALANEWGVPAWVVRLGFVVLTPVGGLGFLLYAIGWLLIPREGEADPVVSRWIDRLWEGQAWLGAVLVAVAAIIVLSSLNIIDDGLIWAGALLVLGVLLYRGDLGSGWSQAPSPPPASKKADLGEPEIPELEEDLEYLADGDDGVPTTPASTNQPPRQPRTPREPSYLGRLTLGAMLVTIGVMVAFDVGGLTHLTSRHYFAAPVLVIGIGLLIGPFFGRSRGLIVLGVLLVPIALVGALVDLQFDGEFGEIDVFAVSAADLEPSYRLAGGDIYLDLRQLELNGETVSVEANIGAGRIAVVLPIGYQVEIDGHVRLGELDILGRTSGGFNVDRLASRPGSGGTILLNLDAGIGQVEVRDYADFENVGAGGPQTLVRPVSIQDLQSAYFLASGTLLLDLRQIPPVARDSDLEVVVDATVGRGDLIVLLPPWLSANIEARSGAGSLDVLGNQMAGADLETEADVQGSGMGHIDLILSVDQGSAKVFVRP